MRIRTTRRLAQAFFFFLFLFLVLIADLRWVGGYPVSLFLELDPLVGVGTAIAAHEIFRGVMWGLLVLAVTLLLGRVFCNWVCPLGTLHQASGWALSRRRTAQEKIQSNRYRSIYQLKYIILAALLAMAVFGSLQIGLLDPIALFHRTMAAAILPVAHMMGGGVFTTQHYAVGAWVIGGILLALVAANLLVPRFFCRALCPLGALLGLMSRFSLWRIERDEGKCNGCDHCLAHCEGASDPQSRLRKSECFVCFNCIEDCPRGSLSLRWLPERRTEITNPEVAGRRVVLAGLVGFALFGFARSSGSTRKGWDKRVIRPPGSLPEEAFLARCIKCDVCLRVCPTNTLQPAGFEAGIEGIWTPIHNMRIGPCEYNCTLCGQVCPTGAIQPISVEQRMGLGEHEGRGPVRIGTAFIDRGRCLPWAMDKPCVVCQEVCPVSPKAIFTRQVTLWGRDGEEVTLEPPYVDPDHCIGCGVCEYECPVKDKAGIRVSAIGETRSLERRLLMP